MTRRILTVLLTSALTISAAQAADELTIGDPAPRFDVEQWIKGDPINPASAKGRNILVVEFWATWCPPCVASIPHLTELQKRHADKGVVVVGISQHDERNTLDAIKEFVAKRKKEIAYRIAFEKDGDTGRAYMDAAGQESIPTVFVIDKAGRIAWIGYPSSRLDKVIEKLIAGTYDIAKARTIFKLNKQCLEALAAAEWNKAVKLADKFSEVAPEDGRPWGYKFRAYALGLYKPTLARRAGEKAINLMKDDADWLNEFAWAALTENGLDGNYDRLALLAAKQCHKASGGTNWSCLDTLALAKFRNGDVEEAIRLQQQAIAHCEMKEMVPVLEQTLERYKKAAAGSSR